MTVIVNVKARKDKYSWKKGLIKTLKNGLIFLVPSLLAWLAGFDNTKYAMLASVGIYYLKNFLENKD